MKIGIYISEIKDEIYEKFYLFIYRKRLMQEKQKEYEIIKWRTYSNLMVQWVQMKRKGRNLSEYLEKYNCKKISVYGIGDIGKLCCDEILTSKTVEMLYIIDSNVRGNYKGYSIILPEQVNNEVDAIIITPVHSYVGIARVLCQYTEAKLISLEDMVVVLNEYEGQEYYE